MTSVRLLALSAVLLQAACASHLSSLAPPTGALDGQAPPGRAVLERGSLGVTAEQPWGAVGDELVVQERLDDGSVACFRRFELDARPVQVEAACPGCGPVWRVRFDRVDDPGDTGVCADPKAPRDGEVRLLAWSAEEASVYRGWSAAAPWVWWYSGVRHGGRVSFHWSAEPDPSSSGQGFAAVRRGGR